MNPDHSLGSNFGGIEETLWVDLHGFLVAFVVPKVRKKREREANISLHSPDRAWRAADGSISLPGFCPLRINLGKA